MPTPDARTVANRLNAQKSTGPKTAEGKARSRANAFKHGLAGQGVAWPGEEQAEVDAFVTDQVALERPQDAREAFLAARAAVLGWQILRADRVEAAHAHARSGRGKYMEMERRDREVEALVARIETEPHRAVRSLLRTKEGCEWVLRALREFLDAAEEGRVLPSQNGRLDALCLPPLPGLLRGSRARMLVEAICHDTEAIWPDGIPGLVAPSDTAPRSEWDRHVQARDEAIRAHTPIWLGELRQLLAARIAEVGELLEELRAEPDPGLELAELTAAFDDSPSGERLRRYQRSNLRERRLALQELEAWRAGQSEREARPEVEPEAVAEAVQDAIGAAAPAAASEPPSDPPAPAQPARNTEPQTQERTDLAKDWLRSVGQPGRPNPVPLPGANPVR